MVLADQEAETPGGKPVGVPIPVAPVVVCVIGIKAVLTQREGVEDGALTVLVILVTVIVPVAFAEPQPPVNGIE